MIINPGSGPVKGDTSEFNATTNIAAYVGDCDVDGVEIERAKDLDGWSQWRFPTSSNPRIDPAELEQARTELGSMVFA